MHDPDSRCVLTLYRSSGKVRRMKDSKATKTVGRRALSAQADPIAYYQRARNLQAFVNRRNPYPKPRGFVFKARTWDDYEAWRKRQENPRLW